MLNTSVASEEGNNVRLPLKKEITAKFPVEKEKYLTSMSCLRWGNNWCAGCDYYLKCSFLGGVSSFCGGSGTSSTEWYVCRCSEKVSTRPALSPCNVSS